MGDIIHGFKKLQKVDLYNWRTCRALTILKYLPSKEYTETLITLGDRLTYNDLERKVQPVDARSANGANETLKISFLATGFRKTKQVRTSLYSSARLFPRFRPLCVYFRSLTGTQILLLLPELVSVLWNCTMFPRAHTMLFRRRSVRSARDHSFQKWSHRLNLRYENFNNLIYLPQAWKIRFM